MKLLYKTRGNASPQGKPRVYFTGHPEDFGPYFDEITDDILKIQNCAVYYDAEPGAEFDREELLRELEQMQLFVIPVTSRFLFQSSRALDLEFPFAMEHHIPVLPLMQESGLEAQFNRKCGDLQMLDKNSRDNTALPYEEKLEKFLASVLVGDELAEKVRAAFDAYVFLSYRKKDRKYAQELMRLIHKNDFCRDIAIWYDEFLTPGENFNEAIGAALEKCSLFTLAVTPSIVEKGNYVMTVEYPEAVKSGKTILPAELVPTDKDALSTYYQDLPPCTDAHDETALSGALLEAVQKLAIRENDGSPEHNFFIGLAYLNGIDVEVDRSRALSLITGAAENGLPEAMEKLVSMCRSGDGVRLDYMEAIRWQEKLAEWRKARYEETQSEDDGLDWAEALWDLGDYWKELARLPEAKEAYLEMYSVSKTLADRFGSTDTKRYLFVSYYELGGISSAEGRTSEAKGYYRRALELSQETSENTPEAEVRRDLSISYDNLGDICMTEGSLSEAKEYYLKALELRRQLYGETQTARAWRGLFVSYSRLGNVSRAEGRISEAKDHYLKALDICRRLFEEAPGAGARHDLAVCYNKLGTVCEREDSISEAKEYYEGAGDMFRQLCEEAPTVEARRDLSFIYNKLGGVCEAEGRLSPARDYYKLALDIRRQLYEEAPTLRARRDLAVSYNKLGSISRDAEEAREYYAQAAEIAGELGGE